MLEPKRRARGVHHLPPRSQGRPSVSRAMNAERSPLHSLERWFSPDDTSPELALDQRRRAAPSSRRRVDTTLPNGRQDRHDGEHHHDSNDFESPSGPMRVTPEHKPWIGEGQRSHRRSNEPPDDRDDSVTEQRPPRTLRGSKRTILPPLRSRPMLAPAPSSSARNKAPNAPTSWDTDGTPMGDPEGCAEQSPSTWC